MIKKAEAQTVKILHDAQASVYEIAYVLKRPVKTVYTHLRDMGLEILLEEKNCERKSRSEIIRPEVLLNLWLKGLNVREIGEIIGWSRDKVRPALAKMPQYSCPSVRAERKNRKITELATTISALSKEGYTRKQIAAELNMPYGSVTAFCIANGIVVKSERCRENLVGKEFGYWRVLFPLGYKDKKGGYSSSVNVETRDGSYYWQCLCLGCNKVSRPVSHANLKSNLTKSCMSCGIKNRDERKRQKKATPQTKNKPAEKPVRFRTKEQIAQKMKERKAKILALSEQGKTYKEIVAELKIGYHTLRKFCQKNKIRVKSSRAREDFTGETFDNWNVLSPLGYKHPNGEYSESSVGTKDTSYYWECVCLECNTIDSVRGVSLRCGNKVCSVCRINDKRKTNNPK